MTAPKDILRVFLAMPALATLWALPAVTPVPPTLSASFSPSTVVVGDNSILSITVTNSNDTALTNVAFSNTVPAGLSLITQTGGTCSTLAATGGGTTMLDAPGGTFSSQSTSLPAGASCNITLRVNATVAGAIIDTTSTVTSNEAGPGVAASATLNAAALAATSFSLVAQAMVTVFNQDPITITCLDQGGHTFTGYNGTVNLTSTADPNLVYSSGNPVTLVNGTLTFNVSPKTTGMWTVTAVDSVDATITGTSNLFTATPGPTTSFLVSANSPRTAGTAFNFTVTAVDLNNNTTPAYSGTVSFSSSDTLGALPGSSMLISGTKTFTAVLHTPGNQTITATDTPNSLTGTSGTIQVNAVPSPTLAEAFGTSPINVSGTTSLTFTVSNPNSSTGVQQIGFSDTLPAGLVVATPNGQAGTCLTSNGSVVAGTPSAIAGGGSISLSSLGLAASASCTFSVNVTGSTAGSKVNTTGTITSVEGGTGTFATATLIVNSTPPTVSSTVPASVATAVPIGSALSATFSEAMNPLNINTSTFNLKQGTIPVIGVVTYAGVTAIFTPSSTLAPTTLFTATITTGVTDLTGNALASNYVWTFTTGATPDTTPPTVSSTVPANAATAVPIGSALSATFSEAMNPLTISTSTFNLKQGTTPVIGTVTYAGVTATFTPLSTLAPNALFTATITTGVTDLAGNALASNYVWTFTTGATPDTTPPTVSSTVPGNGATAVPVGSALSATFSEAMNPLTINTSTFNLKRGTSPVLGTVSYAGVTATFTPIGAFAPNTLFTATITTGVTDLAGNALVSNHVWNFTTGTTPDTTPPTVISTSPANGATLVTTSANVVADFSELMNPLTISTATFMLQQGTTPVVGTVSYAGAVATFTPLGTLAPNALFTATITTGVTDLAGNALVSNHVWSFTTGTTPDTTPPTVISTSPANGATLVTTTANVVANFSELMNPLTISNATFILRQGTTPIPGAVIYGGTSATFRPTNNLTPNTQYNALVTSAATDLAGNPLTANYLWSFTTGSSADQAPVCLANFAVLSGIAIHNTGSTAVTGDIGVSPGATVSGFPPGTLTGTIHAGDSAAAQGILDLSSAYTDAVSRSVGAVSVAGDLGGQTFTAGLYKSASSLNITSGDLTLDAKGDANAVFIFQMASTLTTAAGSRIILVGGAKAFNVFWQAGTSATLGDNSVLNGSILASQSITLNTGATVSGRLLAQNGAVTLQSNIIASPPPTLATRGILDAASDAGTVAAGSIVSVFGNNLGSSLMSATGYPLPTTLGGSSFQVGTQAASLYMTSCSQANLQIPWEAVGQVPVIATVGGLVSTEQTITVAPFAPGIFSLNQMGSGQGAVEIAPTFQLAAPLGPAGRPVKRGEYIAIFCTGLGPVSNQPATGAAALSDPLSSTLTLPTVTIGTVAAQVSYSGLAPGFAGLYQVNAVVPDNVPSGNHVNLVISIGGVQSNTVTIAIQ